MCLGEAGERANVRGAAVGRPQTGPTGRASEDTCHRGAGTQAVDEPETKMGFRRRLPKSCLRQTSSVPRYALSENSVMY